MRSSPLHKKRLLKHIDVVKALRSLQKNMAFRDSDTKMMLTEVWRKKRKAWGMEEKQSEQWQGEMLGRIKTLCYHVSVAQGRKWLKTHLVDGGGDEKDEDEDKTKSDNDEDDDEGNGKKGKGDKMTNIDGGAVQKDLQ